MITLLQYYPYCAGSGGTGGDYVGPWMPYTQQLGDCEVCVVVNNHNSGTALLQLETGVDGVNGIAAGASISAGALGSQFEAREIEGAMVRLKITAVDAAIMTLSVYLVPKQS